MADTTFSPGTVVASTWLNDVNGATYNGTGVFTPAQPGAPLSTHQAKLRETVSVQDFGAVGDGVTDDTTAVQNAITWAAANGKKLEFKPVGIYSVSSLSTTYNSLSRNFIIDLCGSTIKARGTVAGALFTLLNARCVKIMNGVLDGSWSLTTTLLMKHWANAGASASYCRFQNISFRNSVDGFQLGDASRPDEPFVSENTMDGCDFIGVLNPIWCYGAQGEINIIGTKCTANSEGWTIFPASYTLNGITSVGGNVRMTGGQINSYGGNGISIRPIVSVPSGNLYGKVFCSNTWIETQDRVGVAENPSAIATTVGGIMSFIGCAGAIASTDSFACFDAASDYKGEVVVQGCYFFSGVTRTQPNINMPAAATINVDSKSFNPYIGTNPAFGAGLVSGIAGFAGGKLLYDSTSIQHALLVQQNAIQSLPNAVWTKIQLQNKIFDTASAFSLVNYRFTPTTPGYYQINAQVQIANTNFPAGVDIYKNGVSTGYAIGGFQVGVLNGTASLSRVLYLNGTTDYLEVYGFQASGGAVDTATAVTQLSISYLRAT